MYVYETNAGAEGKEEGDIKIKDTSAEHATPAASIPIVFRISFVFPARPPGEGWATPLGVAPAYLG